MAIIYNNYCVYIHTTPSNKAYIGITSQKPEHRWNNGRGYKQHRYFYSAIKKYGWNNIQHNIFADNLTKEQACKLEKLLISIFNTTDRQYGYNIGEGGDVGNRGCHLSYETRQVISKRSRGRIKSKEEIEKIRQGRLGYKTSDETKKKLHNINVGKKLSEETKQKISEACRGKVYSNSNQIYCVELDMVFPSSTKACEYIGHPHKGGNILKVCKGQSKTVYGYHWQYANTKENG